MKCVLFTIAIVAPFFMAEGASFRVSPAFCPRIFATGLFRYPPDCSKFLNCWNGQAFLQDCAPGTVFNPKIGVCDWPYNVRCRTHGGEGFIDPRVKIVRTYRWKLKKLINKKP